MRLGRPKTEDEKEEYKDLNEVTAEVVFMDKANTVAQGFVKAHKPFCRKCALEHFNMQKSNLYNELKMRHGRDFTEKEKPFMDLVSGFDFAKYGSPEHFTLIGVERKNIRRREGGDVWFELVVNKSFACKPYGHGCTVSIAQSDMNEEELAEENKRVVDRKAKISATSSTEDLPVAGDELANRMPVGTKVQQPTLNPSGNTVTPPIVPK